MDVETLAWKGLGGQEFVLHRPQATVRSGLILSPRGNGYQLPGLLLEVKP